MGVSLCSHPVVGTNAWLANHCPELASDFVEGEPDIAFL